MNTCVIEIDGKEYSLSLTRNSVKKIEAKGFDIQEFARKPITMMDILWYGGFLVESPEISIDETTKLLESYQNEGGDVQEVIQFLAEEYASFANAPTDTKSVKKAKINKVR